MLDQERIISVKNYLLAKAYSKGLRYQIDARGRDENSISIILNMSSVKAMKIGLVDFDN